MWQDDYHVIASSQLVRAHSLQTQSIKRDRNPEENPTNSIQLGSIPLRCTQYMSPEIFGNVYEIRLLSNCPPNNSRND
jgi:hypothetical protein